MVATDDGNRVEQRSATVGDSGRGPSTGEPSMTEALSALGTVDTTSLVVELGVTPEECVRRLVEEHGGRLAQRDLVSIVPWSAATVSRLLSRLEDAREVVRLPYGRSKVVFLPEQTPAGAAASEA